jgi:hypothetical protein
MRLAMVFTASSFGLFTLVLTREKLDGLKMPFILPGYKKRAVP